MHISRQLRDQARMNAWEDASRPLTPTSDANAPRGGFGVKLDAAASARGSPEVPDDASTAKMELDLVPPPPPDGPMAKVDRMLAEVAEILSGQAFAYLGRRGDGSDPYDLQVVPAAAVRTGRLRAQHYTISEAGVTQFRRVDKWNVEAQFTPLVAWRNECRLFRQIGDENLAL